jgi:hypothetical protein
MKLEIFLLLQNILFTMYFNLICIIGLANNNKNYSSNNATKIRSSFFY